MNFASAFPRLMARPGRKARGDTSSAPHRVVVFVHVVGGAGATTLAVNTAYALNPSKVSRSSCLLDLDVQFGTAARILDLPASSGVEQLIENPRALEDGNFDRFLTAHTSGLQVLTAPRIPVPLQALKRAAVGSLIQSCRARFPVVVVDMPVALTAWTDVVLKSAARIYLVTPVSVPAAHAARALFTLFDQHDLASLPFRIVVNRRQTADKKQLILTEKFCEAIGRPISIVVPDEYELVQRSHNEGVPAIELAPKSRFARAIEELASDITSAEASSEGPAIGAVMGW